MKRGILITLVALTLLAPLGCSRTSGVTGSSAPASPQIVRQAEIGGKWEMRHITLEIGAGEELPILLKLADGNTVDGYFYLEKGSNVDFKITANSLLYQAKVQDGGTSRGITSDRFAFTASQAQGGSYTLTFRNNASAADKTRVQVFLEIVYPKNGSLFTLLEPK